MLQPGLGDVLSRDDTRDTVVLIQYHQVAQTHRTEKPVIGGANRRGRESLLTVIESQMLNRRGDFKVKYCITCSIAARRSSR